MKKTITVVIADDHPIFRRGLRDVVAEDSTVKLIGEADQGETALKLIQDLKPRVAVLDHDMPRLNGLQVARAARQRKLGTALVMLTMFKEERLFNEAINAGFLGYVLKESAVTDLLLCIHSVAQDTAFISPLLSGFLLQRASHAKALTNRNPGLEKLTPAERRVIRLIAEDLTSKEIGDHLGISFHTVENHRANICAKLLLSGSHSLLKFAFENKSRL